MQTEPPALLTPTEVADMLRVSRRQVYNWVNDPTHPLTGTLIGQKSMRIYESSVHATIARGHVNANS